MIDPTPSQKEKFIRQSRAQKYHKICRFLLKHPDLCQWALSTSLLVPPAANSQKAVIDQFRVAQFILNTVSPTILKEFDSLDSSAARFLERSLASPARIAGLFPMIGRSCLQKAMV
jgi:hypothetical protein